MEMNAVGGTQGTKFSRIKMGIKKLAHFSGELPQYQSVGASGFDIRAQISAPIELKPGERAMVPTALSFEIPMGFEIQVRPRSGLAAKQGIMVVNTPGTVDADYRGEVKVILINMGTEKFVIQNQDRIAQCVLCPVWQCDFELKEELSDTVRGAGGFGSTGV